MNAYSFYSAPSAPVNVVIYNTTSTSITVTWQPPITPNGIVRLYRIRFTTGGVADNINSLSTLIVINMLEIFVTYQIQVFARTIVEGTGSDTISVTTDQDSKFIAALTLSFPTHLDKNGLIFF